MNPAEPAGRGEGGREFFLGVVAIVGLALTGWTIAAASGAVRDDAAELRDPAAASPAVDRLTRSIDYMEARWARGAANAVLGARLADRHLARFRLAADARDLERAERIARMALRYARDEAAARARLSHVLLARHRFREALAEARAATAADPDDAAARGTQFDAALAMGAYAEAESALAALPAGTLTRRLREARWLMAHGRSEEAHDRMLAACRELDGAPVRGETRAWCWTELAAIQRELAGPEAAMAVLGRALEAQPGYRGAVEALADLARDRGRLVEAASLYERLLSDAHPDLHLRLAEVRRALGDREEADRHERAFLALATRPGAERLHVLELARFYARCPESLSPRLTCEDALERAVAMVRREAARRPAVEVQETLARVLDRRATRLRALGVFGAEERTGLLREALGPHLGAAWR